MTLEEKIANASKVDLYYKPPYEYRYAVVEYCCRKGRPLKVAEYYIYGEQLTRSGLTAAIVRYNKRRGVEKTSIHLFRHTFAKNYIIAGGNPVKLQHLLNHKTIEMTMKYVNLYGTDIATDLDVFNPLDNFKRKNYTPTKRVTIKAM